MTLTMEQREAVWRKVIELCATYTDVNDKATVVQNAIAEFGPVPDVMGDAVREAMKP